MEDLSCRATSFLDRTLQVDFRSVAESNAYNKNTNPNGIVSLASASNHCVWDLVQMKLKEVDLGQMPEYYIHYNEAEGPLRFREMMAAYLNRYLKPLNSIREEDVSIHAGAGAVNEVLGTCLFDAGDTVLVPSPTYYGFQHDLTRACEVNIETFPVNFEPSSDAQASSNLSVMITRHHLEAALKKAEKDGHRVKAILIVTPNNPVGKLVDRTSLLNCVQFCEDYNLHLISDEVYFGSLHNVESTFLSILQVTTLSPCVHVLWSFSKDFGLCGFRLGALVTRNKNINKFCNASINRSVSTLVQYALEPFISDFDWLDHIYIPTNQRRLRAKHDSLREELQSISIPSVSADGGLFVWADFSKLLKDSNGDEVQLFNDLLEAGVHITPGFTCGSIQPGWYRIVFSVEDEILNLALSRLKKFVASRSTV